MSQNIEEKPVTWGALVTLGVWLIAVGGGVALIGFVMWAKSQ